MFRQMLSIGLDVNLQSDVLIEHKGDNIILRTQHEAIMTRHKNDYVLTTADPQSLQSVDSTSFELCDAGSISLRDGEFEVLEKKRKKKKSPPNGEREFTLYNRRIRFLTSSNTGDIEIDPECLDTEMCHILQRSRGDVVFLSDNICPEFQCFHLRSIMYGDFVAHDIIAKNCDIRVAYEASAKIKELKSSNLRISTRAVNTVSIEKVDIDCASLTLASFGDVRFERGKIKDLKVDVLLSGVAKLNCDVNNANLKMSGTGKISKIKVLSCLDVDNNGKGVVKGTFEPKSKKQKTDSI